MRKSRIGAIAVGLTLSSVASTVWAKETIVNPGESIQTAINAAAPGDIVTVKAGTYAESLKSAKDGSKDAPITVRAEPGAVVIVSVAGQVLLVTHAYFVVEGLVLDAQYAAADAVHVDDAATGLVIRNTEIRKATKDCIDMGAPKDVVIEGSHIHHCLNSAGATGQTDAHGVTGGAVQNLVIRGTEIETISGDCIQFDPGRELPGWTDIRIESSKLWTGPLATAENGFAVGTVPGENAVDTKTNPAAPRAKLTIVDTEAWGFRGGLITNMAAFNMKENIDVVLDRVTVHDSEIAFRLRGPGSNGGAWVRVQNAVVYDVDKAVRYEDDIEKLAVFNTTFGNAVTAAFQEASAPNTKPDVRNLLVLAGALPSQASAASNKAVDATAFVAAATHDYHLAAGAAVIDQGETIAEVTLDRDGTPRPQGGGYDVGAYEDCAGTACGSGAGGSSGSGGSTSSGGTPGTGATSSTGATGSGAKGGSSSGGAGTGGAKASGDSGDDGGCGCRAAPRSRSSWIVLLGALTLLARRLRVRLVTSSE